MFSLMTIVKAKQYFLISSNLQEFSKFYTEVLKNLDQIGLI